MLVVAITGGLGSGKTQVSHLFKQEGVPYIDADTIARKLTSQGGDAYTAIRQHFGHIILQPNGDINRQTLRKIIFAQPEQKEWLEKLLHPLINRRMKEQIAQSNAPYCVVEIPLLAESGKKDWVDRVLVIDCPSKSRIERVKSRDNLSETEIKTILESQVTRSERLAIADEVLENTGSLKELREKVKHLHDYYLHLAKQA